MSKVTVPVLQLTPVNISNQLAKLNQAILNPELYNKLKGAGSNAVYVRIKDFIMTCGRSPDVPMDKVGLNKKTRQYLYVSMTEPVAVQPYAIPVDRETSLAYLEFEIQFQNPPNNVVELDDEKIVEQLKTTFLNTFFKPKQVFYITFQGYLLVLTVVKSEVMHVGAGPNLMGNDGRLVKETEASFTAKLGDKLRLKNDQGQSQNLFRPDFKMEDMGIGGLDEELTNIFRRAFASRRFPPAIVAKMGIEHVKGILLYGPPGTGKTLIARQLAKVLKAKELTIVNGPQIFSKYVGQSEENIRKLFLKARQDEQAFGDQSPLHVIVFDQIDAICKGRSGGNNAGSNASDLVVNQLLTNIQGVEALNNILVIGMTNRKDLIDEAILRPGRFDVHIEVGLPNQHGRMQILHIHTKNLKNNGLLDSSVDFDQLSKLTKNFTGAEIEALVKSASSFSMSRNYDIMDFTKEIVVRDDVKVEMGDFLKALNEVKPQFGIDDEKFDVFLRGKLYNYGKRFEKIMHTLQDAVNITKNGQSTQLNSILLEGEPGTGKSSIAAYFAKKCQFPFVKIISPQSFVGYTEGGKLSAIVKIFEDAYRSPQACIIVDNIERLLDFVNIGPRFNNHMLQSLLVLFRRLPKKAECRLLLIATTSCSDLLEQLEIPNCFTSRIQVPVLNQEELKQLMVGNLNFSEAQANQVLSVIKKSPIKKFLQAKDMAGRKGLQAWKQAWQSLDDITF